MPIAWFGKLKTPPRPMRAPALGLTLVLLLVSACADQRPTEPSRGPEGVSTSLNSTGVFRDDFSDPDGTLLQNHTPDGGGDPFAWVLPSVWGVDAFIRDSAVGAVGSDSWAYVTSEQTGDWAELTVDVFQDVDATGTTQDIVVFLRTVEADNNDGYAVFWSVSPGVNSVSLDSPDQTPDPPRVDLPTPVSQGLHTFRAEINASNEIEVRIDGALVMTAPAGALPAPGRTGIGFFLDGPPSVRITSFSAGPVATGPAIQVACVPQAPVRGDTVGCTARLSPGAGTSLAISKWTFIGLTVPAAVIENTSDTVWAGPAAFAGTVLVEGEVDGVTKTGQGTFLVEPRTGWSQKQAVHVATEVPSELPIQPAADSLLGQTQSITLGYAPADRRTQVTSGPNKNWYYATAVPIIDSSKIMINRAALAVGSDFWRIQHPGGGHCPKSEVPAFLPKAIAHEGLNFEVNAHSWAYSTTLDQTVGDLVEGAVGATPEELAARARDAAAPAVNRAEAASEEIDFSHPILMSCSFRYDF